MTLSAVTKRCIFMISVFFGRDCPAMKIISKSGANQKLNTWDGSRMISEVGTWGGGGEGG